MKTPPRKQAKKTLKKLINWFEIPASNFERAVEFYSEILNLKMETDEMNGYSMAFFPVESGAGGAIICGEGSVPSQTGPLLYLDGGDNLDQILMKVEEAGGKIILNKQKINDSNGYFALFIDSEGNKMALHSNS